MARREVKPFRGVFERPKGSGVWWINFYVGGTQHREKVGARGAAIDLYGIRKADAMRGIKLPDLRRGKLTMSALIDDALEFAKVHNNRSLRDYICKGEIVRSEFGFRAANGITPQEIDRWLTKHCKTNATANRYKAFISLTYREAIRNQKVEINPARLVRQRKELGGRLRFLTRQEYESLAAIISRRYPEHLDEFIVSIFSGMRLSEQYSCKWRQVDLDRHVIDLTKTKNDEPRLVPLNTATYSAIERQRARLGSKHRPSDLVFPRKDSNPRFDNRSWFKPCLNEAGITGYVWHSNRHTFCSWLAMKGVSIKEIQVLAGHKTLTMSARYSHLSPEHTLSASERIVDP